MRLTPVDRGASTLFLQHARSSILIDSYLGHSYVAPVAWNFRSWREEAPEAVPPSALGATCLIITSAEGDHLQPEVLVGLDHDTRVYAEAAACSKLRRLGFRDVSVLRAGQSVTLGRDLDLLALDGYNPILTPHLALLFRDSNGATLLIAHHGLVWSSRTARMVSRFLRSAPLDAACLPVEPAHLKVPGLPRAALPYRGTITPEASEMVPLLRATRARQVYLTHELRERRAGFVVDHLLRFPAGHRYVETSSFVMSTSTAARVAVGVPKSGVVIERSDWIAGVDEAN